jgi:YggT family protein
VVFFYDIDMAIGSFTPKENTIVEPETGEKPVVKVEPPQQDYEKKKEIIKSKQLIWYLWLTLELILLVRFLVKLFGANPDSFFNFLIEVITFPFVAIFIGLFEPIVSPSGRIVVEWSTLFAMFFYFLAIWVITRFIKLKKPIGPQEAEQKVEQTIP